MSRESTTTGFTISLLAAVLLAGCASAPEPVTATRKADTRVSLPANRPAAKAPQVTNASPSLRAATIAAGQVGKPYRYGGATPAGFDCSGLVHYAYGRVGVATPRTTSALWRSLQPIQKSSLAVGDVLFFDIEGKVAHVGVYLGQGRFVHAPSSGRNVTFANLDSGYYRQAFVRAGRIQTR